MSTKTISHILTGLIKPYIPTDTIKIPDCCIERTIRYVLYCLISFVIFAFISHYPLAAVTYSDLFGNLVVFYLTGWLIISCLKLDDLDVSYKKNGVTHSKYYGED